MTDTTAEPARPAWVAAEPFRAHLWRVVAASGLPWQVVALSVGVALRQADHLLHGRPQGGGRPRRPLRRISHDTAWRVLSATEAAVAALDHTRVPAAPTAARLADLLARGVGVDALAAQLRCTPSQVVALAESAGPDGEGRVPRTVTLAFALGVRAAGEAADRAALRAWSAAA